MNQSKKKAKGIALAGILALIFGAGVLNPQPDIELHQYWYTPIRVCSGGGSCLVQYRTVIGNTGKHAVSNVEFFLSEEFVRRLKRPPVARVQGIRNMPLVSRDVDGKRRYSISEIEPDDFVDLELLIQFDRKEGQAHWEHVLSPFQAKTTAVKRGDPRMIRFGRLVLELSKFIW